LELNKKISSYKQQDIIRGFYEPEKFITINSIVKNLYDCKLECYYCTQKMVILYEIVREMKQWSVDRINNNLGHNRDNIVIACLDCNLKRRRTGKAAFLFTKQLNIIKGV
jgi:5-methylcytosine-specific restriction endonuclease McrA